MLTKTTGVAIWLEQKIDLMIETTTRGRHFFYFLHPKELRFFNDLGKKNLLQSLIFDSENLVYLFLLH